MKMKSNHELLLAHSLIEGVEKSFSLNIFLDTLAIVLLLEDTLP